MNENASSASRPASTSRATALLFAVMAFVLGLVLAGVWFHWQPSTHAAASSPMKDTLLPVTSNSLAHLSEPVAVKYYSLLPAGSVDSSVQAFAGRVSQLLQAVQQASGGKVTITRVDTPSDANDNAASADGIRTFNLARGSACFLGLAISSGRSRQTLARLQPQWEPALQFDVVRAISRAAAGNQPAPPPPAVAKPSLQVVTTIKQLIPDVKTVSMAQASQILHAEYLKQCSAIGAETEAKIKAAEQQVVQAQTSGSAAALQAARKNLLQVQLSQANKLKALAAQLQTELAVFQRMKAGARTSAN